MNRVHQGILSALAYYDAFDFPLTAQEIFLALPAAEGPRPAYEDLERALADAVRLGEAGRSEGLYFLPGREAAVATRKARYLLAEGKYARVRKFFALARFAPYLRAAFVCNTLARSYARSGSDIDMFVVAAPGRIWLTRLFVTGLAALLRVRPTETESADRICLSFFATEDALDLKPLAIAGDVYLPHWLQELYPIYDESGAARSLFARNGWLRDVLPGTRIQAPSQRRIVPPRLVGAKRALERLCDALFGDRHEHWAERRQKAWMPAALRAAADSPSSGVVLSDRILKFHDHDRRAEIRDAYLKKMKEVTRRHPASAEESLVEESFASVTVAA
ncbi:MAG TPA: hypothetical protein VL283_04940 [Candidatus Baltobacteraceae bacterium]|nr:hypothetical protein [Candidatus Baltobacteraceae bacterium]